MMGRKLGPQVLLATALVIANECLYVPASLAEVVPNGLNTNVDVQSCSPSCAITGGRTRGTNLFHSFEEFSIPRNGVATFQHDGAIANIITRVTGGSTSRINGTLQTLLDGSTDDMGTADFFFINPNGIVFGSQAQLNIGGSFIGSTAESLQFEDDTEFSVNDADPLLTISVPTGLQFGTDPSNIRVAGPGNSLFLNPDSTVNRSDRPIGLEIASGHTLALVGGAVNLNGGNLTADSGRIEIGAVDSESAVALEPNSNRVGWSLDYSEVDTFGNLQLTNAASADVSGDDAGTLSIQGSTILMEDGSALLANTLVNGGGTILVNATEKLQMDGISATIPSEPFSPMPTSAYIEISPGALGDGSSELSVITTDLLATDGAQMGLSMGGLGFSGVFNIKADTIIADRDAPSAFSGFFAAVLPVFPSSEDAPPPALGTGGDLIINTNRLQVSNGAQILVNTFGIGDAGDLSINAKDIDVFGFSDFGSSSLQAASEFPPTGKGGQITINTERLSVSDGGQISTSTASITQPAGNIIIRASDSVELQGTAPPGQSGLFATAVSLINPGTGEVVEAAGEGGSIVVETSTLIVSDGATMNVGNQPSNPDSPVIAPGNGPAGNLTVIADLLQLDNQAVITANTVDGDRANITLDADLIVLRDQSLITTNATGSATGGNLAIDTLTLTAFNNSDITANAVESRGGNIQIRAQGIFGIQPRESLTPFNDITASSEFGLDGTIIIESPDVEPEQGLVDLPAQVVDVTQLIAQACRQDDQLAYSQLSMTGRGGVPSHPAGFLTRRSIVASPSRPIEATEVSQPEATDIRLNSITVSNPIPLSTETVTPITEASGWSIAPKGQVILAAEAQVTSSHAYAPQQPEMNCNGL